jgi:nucleoside-diphosphate-sugar epimerase
MKIVITGGAGFLGQRLIRALCERGRLTAADGIERQIDQVLSIDQIQSGRLYVDDRVGYVLGDIASPALLHNVVERDTACVFHLAAVSIGAAESDFELGLRVNLDATRALLDVCRRQRTPPRFVFAGSVSVFGGAFPSPLDDATMPQPASSYGMQKLIGELLVAEYTRRGYVDGRSLRLPTVFVRPGQTDAVLASFASNVVAEALAGRAAICPVGPDAALWIQSPRAAVANFIHASELPADRWGTGGLNLPGLTATLADVVDAVRAVGGDEAAARIRFEPDPRVRRIVDGWPARFDTARANGLGFVRDANLAEIVGAYAAETSIVGE